jgi:hypothetical protein
MENEVIPNDYFEPIGEKSSDEFTNHDYFGMAQDLKRMRKAYAQFYNWKMIPFESANFYMALKEFEQYCLEQEYIID